MKPFLVLVLAALIFPRATPAVENKYDVLAKVLMPFANLLAEKTRNPNRAVQLTARLEAMTDLPAALAGSTAELALEYPDKMRLRGPLLGEMLTLCRQGQSVWVSPGSKAAVLLEAATATKKLPPLDPKARLEPFRLPVPEKQLVFLPALFRVADGGSESVAGESCRVLDLGLVPELERSLKMPGLVARVWVRPNGTPARLIVQQPDWEIVVGFDRVEFSPSLPATTWQPGPEDSADVLKLSPGQFQQLLGAFIR